MKVKALAFAAGALALTGAANADFTGAHIEDLGDLGAGVSTYRVYVDFSSPSDQLLAVSGNAAVSALYFNSLDGDALRNTAGGFAGLSFEDFPFPGIEAWDSWVTLGTDTPGASDADFSPGFLGGSGSTSVINGTSFSQATNGGWFDSNPGTPETGESILIAQFTVANFEFGATADWQSTGSGATSSAFYVTTVPAPGALALLGLAGVAARRRRRG
jgi:hypothetical protein